MAAMPARAAPSGALLPVFVLTGPTGAGKSEWAERLAQAAPVEIVSVDSALVYRGLDIGSAKPDRALRQRQPLSSSWIRSSSSSKPTSWRPSSRVAPNGSRRDLSSTRSAPPDSRYAAFPPCSLEKMSRKSWLRWSGIWKLMQTVTT